MAEAGLSESIRKPGWFAPRNEKNAFKAITEAGKLPTAEDVIADPKKYQGIAADLDASDRDLLKLEATKKAKEAEADALRAAGKRDEALTLENKATEEYKAGKKAAGEKRAATLSDVDTARTKARTKAEDAYKSARKANAKARAARAARRGRMVKGGLFGLGAAALGAGAALYHERSRDEKARGSGSKATALMDRAMSGEDLSEADVDELQQSFSPETFAVIMSQRQATLDGDPSYIDQADMVDEEVEGAPAYELPEDAPAANKMLGTALDWILGGGQPEAEPAASTNESSDAGSIFGWGAANAAGSTAPIDIDPVEYARIRDEQGQAAADEYVQEAAVTGAANADDQGWIDFIDSLGSPDLSAAIRGEQMAPSFLDTIGDANNYIGQNVVAPWVKGINTVSDWIMPGEGGILEPGNLSDTVGDYLWAGKDLADLAGDTGLLGRFQGLFTDTPAVPNAGDAERWANEDAQFNAEQRQAPGLLRSPGMDISPEALTMLPFVEPGYDTQPLTPMDTGGLYDPTPRDAVMPQMRPGPGVSHLGLQESPAAGLGHLVDPEAVPFGSAMEGPDRIRSSEREPDEVIKEITRQDETGHAPGDRAPDTSGNSDLTPVTINAPGAAGPSAPPAASQGDNPGNFTTSSANLADDAEDAEADLNRINRMWRDRFGLDASERGKMARSLASFGATLASTPGSFFSAFPQAVGAGFGEWDEQTNQELERLMAEMEMGNDAILNDARIQELLSREALNEVKARVEAAKINPNGGLYPTTTKGTVPASIQETNLDHATLVSLILRANPGMSEEEADMLATEQIMLEKGYSW